MATTDGESADSFRRLARDRTDLDALDLYARVVERSNRPIGAPDRIQGAVEEIRQQIVSATARPTTLYGWRTQGLFEAVAASLGKVRLLKVEDSGDVFFTGDDMRPPDFHVVTQNGERILVEVKNHHSASPRSPIKLRRSDVEALQRYTDLLGASDLKLAIYWSRWNLWTLTSASLLQSEGPRHLTMSLLDAMKSNEMSALGDGLIGTEWPLSMTLHADPSQDREIDDDQVNFTIGRVDMKVAGRLVTDSAEQQILFRLMTFGGWEETTEVTANDNTLESVSFVYEPPEPPARPPAIHSALSSIFSAMFIHASTGDDAEITALRLNIQPGALASLIPDDYRGEELRVWRIRVRPSPATETPKE